MSINKKIKLNLGCGLVYKPGYINIDNFESSIADVIDDSTYLQYENNTIDEIEANQLIEHFDYINCKYVLSDWFRTLKPEGRLIIETPDLEKAFKKFSSGNIKIKKKTLQWIYGIDNPGLDHKTGFTFDLLKSLLEETGFINIFKKTPVSHKYESSLRIECKKPSDNIKYQIFSIFREEIKDKLSINESNLLSSLEEHCIEHIRTVFFNEFEKNKKNAIKKIITKTAINNPLISLIFCEKCIEFGLLKKEDFEKEFQTIKYLIKIKFHKRLFPLWKNYKKEIGRINDNFSDFLDNQELNISKMLENSNVKNLDYITNLQTEDIKIFNFHVVQLKALILSNKGVKEFYNKDYQNAIESLLNSVALFPDNAIAHWNIAKLGIETKMDSKNILNHYEKSITLTVDKNTKNILKQEMKYFKNKEYGSISINPIADII